MAETLRERWVRTYAYQIYVDGTKRFTDIPASYVTDVKTYAARNFTPSQIEYAREQGWITQQEYDDTVLLVPTA
jgi:hypothetical protein